MLKRLIYILLTLSCIQSIFSLAESKPVSPSIDKNPEAPVKVTRPIWRIETNKGTFDIELLHSKAPKTVANFEAYARSGFYTGTIFHRVIPGFVIQGGGFDNSMAKKKTRKPIVNEAKSEVKNLRGTLSMARLSAPNTATSQFFINLKDNDNLDKQYPRHGYAVFARIINGMNVVEQIAYMPTHNVGIYRDVPVEPIIITSIKEIPEKAKGQ